jgi:hypothetical protein
LVLLYRHIAATAWSVAELRGTVLQPTREPILNEHMDEEDGPLVFLHACKLGLEGIVSKRRDSPYSSGRSRHWIKSKNPNAPAVSEKLRRIGQLAEREASYARLSAC